MKGWRWILLPAVLAAGALLVAVVHLGDDGAVAQQGLSVALDVVEDGADTFCNPVDDSVSGVSGSHKVAVCAMNLPGAVGAFYFDVVYDSDLNECPDVANFDTALDDNPDANAGSTTYGVGDDLGGGWDCSNYGFMYPECDGDQAGEGIMKARMSCLSISGPWTLGDDESDGVLAVVSFNAVGEALDTMSLADVVLADTTAVELGSCNPYVTIEIPCYGADVDKQYVTPTVTPTPAVTPTPTITPTPTPTGTPTGQPAPDWDGDGVSDSFDACPTVPEDLDGFEDSDGCPETDNDMDGICDPWYTPPVPACVGSDECPNVEEDIDAFKDDDGCPDADNDNDGFPDYTDDCPGTDWTAGPDGIADTGDEPLDEYGVPIQTREDYDGVIDSDGCHDSPGDDYDGDSVPDEAEVFLNFTDPTDPDTDGDGFWDRPEDDFEGVNTDSGEDNCPTLYNADQLNSDTACIPNGDDIGEDCRANPDNDLEGNACDLDDDNDGPDANDGLYDDSEEATGCGFGATDALDKDSDGDRAIDGYECKVGTDPNNPAQRPTCPDPTDTDGDGFSDCVEELGYGTLPGSVDTDGDSSGNDGCQDDKEIVDVNGDGQANILDVQAIAGVNLGPGPWDAVSRTVVDMNKDGANNMLDLMLAVLNSSLGEPHDPC